MENIYNAENDIKLEFPKIPKYSKSMLEGIQLKLKENGFSISKNEYTNGAIYLKYQDELTLPNGEIFKGKLTDDESKLNYGQYFWPNNQIYIGKFDEQNRFFTKEGELSKLIFPKGEIFEGEFSEGKITEGTFKAEGKEIKAIWTGGKVNGLIDYKDTIKGVAFKGYLKNGQKEGICKTELKIKDKTFSTKGEYSDGKKNGIFIVREIAPNKDNLYIKGKYIDGERNGYFDIIDKEKGINVNHQYISISQIKLINEYNKKYNENINGKEVSIY